jgi:prophage DNA circulation protein
LSGILAKVGNTPDLDKGLVFLRERELLVTGNYWNLVINFDVQWYQTALQFNEQVFKQLEWSRSHRIQPNKFMDWEEVEQARAAVNQVDQELSPLSKLLSVPKDADLIHRKKRGLINIGGEALKFLFGIATTQQLQEIHVTVESIKTREGDVIHAVQKQLTYLKSVAEAVSQNSVGMAAITRTLKNVIMNALNYQKIWNNTANNLGNLIDYPSNVSRTMRELEFMAIQLQQSVMRLQEGLETSATGRFSSVLITPPPTFYQEFCSELF